MKKIYADNSSTTFPKPKVVADAVYNYLTNIGTNVGRGNYQSAYSTSKIVYETRELICELFNFNEPSNVVFTANITESLNILLKGFLQKGDHVIITSMEHNAVVRPLHKLLNKGISYSVVPCNKQGVADINDLEDLINPSTKLILVNHVSNVSGGIMPIMAISDLAKKHNIAYVIDSAQSAGILPIDFNNLNLCALPLTGHKGLLAPQGIGALLLREDFAKKLETLREGGTGSFSEDLIQPEMLPDKFESGTLNVPGIVGLNASLKWILSHSLESIYEHEKKIGKVLMDNIMNIKGISLHGLSDIENRLSVFSISIDNMNTAEAAYLLDDEYGIMTRCGLHCAPLAHKTLGTFPDGSIRISLGYFNTMEDVEYISKALNNLSKVKRG